jgi:hypothetical protein
MSLDVVDGRSAHEQMAGLRELVMRDEGLQVRLAAIASRTEFVDALVDLARSRGGDAAADYLASFVRIDPLGLSRFQQPVWGAPAAPQAGWLPAQVALADGVPVIDWVRIGDRRLSDAFYETSVRWALTQPFNGLFRFQTPLTALSDWAAGLPTIQPTGFIFHMSRCGSTLAAQMLARSPANIVISEAAPIDSVAQLARLHPAYAGEAGAALLRDMIGVFGQVRDPDARRLFLKLDGWHALMLPLFRRAFPETPWVFLYRDPLEVMVSQMRQRGSQLVPQFVPPIFYGIDLPTGVPDEDYCAQVLAATCEAALSGQAMGRGLVVNYNELPGALFARILPHFGVTPTSEEHEFMVDAARFDAKSPGLAFTPDSAAKRAEASAAITRICADRMEDSYRRLEALRAAQG